MHLKDRVAFVTGAGHGIGAASAERLAREGADLVILDLDADAIEETADVVRRHGRKALPMCVDCTADAAVTEAFARAREAYGKIDILFNNVGQSAREKATEFWCSEPETWRFVLEISFFFFQAEDGIRVHCVTGVQTCALPI